MPSWRAYAVRDPNQSCYDQNMLRLTSSAAESAAARSPNQLQLESRQHAKQGRGADRPAVSTQFGSPYLRK